jgi:signal transduction histidine kinase
MNAVIGMTHLPLQDNPLPQQLEYLHPLKFSAENLLVLINDILDFSKIGLLRQLI